MSKLRLGYIKNRFDRKGDREVKHFYICVAEFETDIPLHIQRFPEIKFYHNDNLKVKYSIDRIFSDGSIQRIENLDTNLYSSPQEVLIKIKCVSK